MSIQIVELAGSPGSGKSTIARSLDNLEINIIRPYEYFRLENFSGRTLWSKRFRFIGNALYTIFRRPSIGWHLFQFWINAGPNKRRFRHLIRLACWLRRLTLLRRDCLQSIVMDEGIIVLLADTLLPSKHNPDPTNVIMSALPGKVDVIVHVKCDVDVAFDRLRNRSLTIARIDHWPEDVALPRHRQADALINRSVHAARNSGILIYEIDSTETAPEENARLIAAWLLDRGAQNK